MRLACCTLLALALLTACATSTDLTDAEKELLVTEADFVEYGLDANEFPSGAFSKTADWLNGSLEYNHTSAEGAEYYVYNTVTIERSGGNALTGNAANNAGNNAGMKIGFLSGGVTEKPIKLTQPIGAQSRLTLLMPDGKPIGNSFTAIIGKTSVLLVYSGIYFETESEFREFIQDKIKKYRT